MADSPTVGLATDLETALSSDLATMPFDLGPATSTICQRTQESSLLPVPQVLGLQMSAPAVDYVVASDPAPAQKPGGKLTRQSDQRS